MGVHVCAYLGGRGELAVGQREGVRVRAAVAGEGQACAEGPDVADSDHGAPDTHQPPKHTGTQSPQRGEGLVVIQPGGSATHTHIIYTHT